MENLIEEEGLVRLDQTKNSILKRRIWEESKKIWRIAFPGIVARVSYFGNLVIAQVLMGYIGDSETAAYSIVQIVFVRFAYGVLVGMSSAMETLCGQAFGRGTEEMMGVYLQRSWIVNSVVATIFLPFFIFTTQILASIGQPKDLSEMAGRISVWFIPLLYYYVFAFTMQMYLQSQMKSWVLGWVFGISFFLDLGLSWIFLTKFRFGIGGVMSAFNICAWSSVIVLFVYVFGWCQNTWKGFSRVAFMDILPFIKLSLSSGVMVCLEYWYYSILVLLAGYIRNATVEISAFSICLNINGAQLMFFFAFLGAASVRVSNELGKGDATAARFSINVILITSTSIGVVFSVLCLIFNRKFPSLFTKSDQVAEEVSNLSVILAFSMLFNSIQPVLSGVAVGSGLQSRVAYVNLGCYYVIGIPLGILLGYVCHFQIKGLWIGMLGGVVSQTTILSWLIWRTNWDDQVSEASERLNRWYMDLSN